MVDGEKKKKTVLLVVVLVVFILLIIGLVVGIVLVRTKDDQSDGSYTETSTEQIQREISYSANADAKAGEIIAKLNADNDYFIEDAVNEFENLINDNKEKNKYYLITQYASFIYNYLGDLDRAIEVLDTAKEVATNDLMADYYLSYRNLYNSVGDQEKVDYYDKLIMESSK